MEFLTWPLTHAKVTLGIAGGLLVLCVVAFAGWQLWLAIKTPSRQKPPLDFAPPRLPRGGGY